MSTQTNILRSTVDLLIVGGGPAGLSAALFFSRLNRPALLYDSGKYRNDGVEVAHTILGNEGVNPAQYRVKARQEIEHAYPWTTFRDDKITSIKQTDKGFEAVDSQDRVVLARKVIMATGIKDHLAPIPGLQSAWGKRLIHCVYCHGTETAKANFGFILATGKSTSFNPMLVHGIFSMWKTLNHTKTYIFTNGLDPASQEAGLGEYQAYIESNPQYEIVDSPIAAIHSYPDHVQVVLSNGDRTITVPFLATFPDHLTPHDDALSLLSMIDLKLGPMGEIAQAEGLPPPRLPPRMGDDARTQIPGLFWAGNCGSPMANVNLAVASGQAAAGFAAEELGSEDARALTRG